jgi:Tol biopolymer transport system component
VQIVDAYFIAKLGTTELVSVSMTGGFGNGACDRPAISADGRYVAFASDSTNLVPNDFNINRDVFRRDRLLGTTILISKDSGGVQGNGFSTRPSISSDGRYVTYRSSATNLVAVDANGIVDDIFLHDTVTGVTELISVSTGGVQADQISDRPSISGDGTRIVFRSNATNLVANDTNLVRDVFLRDVTAGTTILVSVSSAGVLSNAESTRPAISENGEFAVYRSLASNLVLGDNNLAEDVFRYEIATGTTIRVSVSSAGLEGNGDSSVPSINADGTKVVFRSVATDLVPGDANLTEDVFLRDLTAGTTSLISMSEQGVLGNAGSTNPAISGAGDLVGFESNATNLVLNDTNLLQDVFVATVAPPTTNTIALVGPTSASPGTTVAYTWSQAPASSTWWFLYSFSSSGTVYSGHTFDLGPPIAVLGQGTNSASGTGSWTSPVIPGSFSGRTIYFEVAASPAAGQFVDSNFITLVIL